ncbi:MAG: uroporphyrinogen-III synthase [Methyloligellaceae bacterium]
MQLLVTRPADQSAKLVQSMQDLGHDVKFSPLLEIVYVSAPVPDLRDIQALVFTSSYGVRGFANLHENTPLGDMAVFAVGQSTELKARETGFSRVHAGANDAVSLVDVIKGHFHTDEGKILYIRGMHVAVDMKEKLEAEGYRVRQQIVYEARCAKSFSPEVLPCIIQETLEGVILLSQRTARVFVNLVEQVENQEYIQSLKYYCLSRKIADELSMINPSQVFIPEIPNLDELIKLIKDFGTIE